MPTVSKLPQGQVPRASWRCPMRTSGGLTLWAPLQHISTPSRYSVVEFDLLCQVCKFFKVSSLYQYVEVTVCWDLFVSYLTNTHTVVFLDEHLYLKSYLRGYMAWCCIGVISIFTYLKVIKNLPTCMCVNQFYTSVFTVLKHHKMQLDAMFEGNAYVYRSLLHLAVTRTSTDCHLG